MSTLVRHAQPRLSWSIDLITDMPLSTNKYKILMICVDDFANYIIAVPLVNASTEEIKTGIMKHLIAPFGKPVMIRTDEQPGIYNSSEFYNFLTDQGIKLNATAVASPFSNGRAERTIGIFKHSARKYFYHHKCLTEWDKHLSYIVNALNTSVNTFGSTPEEIMFGNRSMGPRELIDISIENDQEESINKLFEKAESLRTAYENRKTRKEEANMTFKNKELLKKKFCNGDLVLHRQLQVSTGTNSKWKPTFTGPFVIVSVNENDHTASCQNLHTNRTIKAHFTNLTHYRYDDSSLRLPETALQGVLTSNDPIRSDD